MLQWSSRLRRNASTLVGGRAASKNWHRLACHPALREGRSSVGNSCVSRRPRRNSSPSMRSAEASKTNN
eukprot:8976273-Pyramimonas_sp.AAC.1